ncbi:MAG TPA: DMT family transporter [Dermatophilaceae bacterium]|nr:DMT family transporter [Dermatophilaceae bacterium]
MTRGPAVGGPATRVPWQAKYLALVLIWGSSFLLMKLGLQTMDALQIATLRILSGAAVLLVLLRLAGGRLPRGGAVWGHLVVCAVFLATLPFTLFAFSETRISSALAGIGNATTTVATVLAALAILPGERVTGRKLGAVVVGFLGVVTILQPWTATDRPDVLGFVMAVAGGASYGIGWTYNRRFLAGTDLGGLAQPAAVLLLGAAQVTPLLLVASASAGRAPWALAADSDPGSPAWLSLACVLVLGLVGTGLAYSLQFDVVRAAGPVTGSTITYLIPVVSVLLGVLVLGEHLAWPQVLGFTVVLGAALVINARPGAPRPPRRAARPAARRGWR